MTEATVNLGALLGVLFVLLAVALVLVLPLKLAAGAMGARRTGSGWCLLALLGASIAHAIGLSFPVYGTVAAFLLSSAAFAALLGTNFLRGIGIAILHLIFSAAIMIIVGVLFGFGKTA